MRVLELETLRILHACLAQREKFSAIFGDRAEVTVERFSQPDVLEARFDYDWAADLLLRAESSVAFFKELEKRKDALRRSFGHDWYNEVPVLERRKLEATTWAEFYIKDKPEPDPEPVSVPESQGERVTEEVRDGD